MKNVKSITKATLCALMVVGALTGCKGKNNGSEDEPVYFGFSVGLKSGLKSIKLGDNTQKLQTYDNGVDNAGRSYIFESSDESIATIDEEGNITPIKEGKVSFSATETKSGEIADIGGNIEIVKDVAVADGGFNYAALEDPEGLDPDYSLNEKTKVLGQLEKYTMNNHLTGITLFDNGGYIKYSDRVKLTDQNYITGFGFGLLSDGEIDDSKTLPGLQNDQYNSYYHGAISQDSLKINQYSATGSQVSDLASYITSSYWGTRRSTKAGESDKYEWYPVLAADKIKKPNLDEFGNPNGTFASELTDNDAPIALEKPNSLNMYKKWRVYVKTDGDVNGSVLKFHTKSSKRAAFNGASVTIDDYVFPYKLLLTGKNNLIRGTEMANDTSHGIKGAARYYNDTKDAKMSDALVNNKWNEYYGNKLGIQTGSDINGAYIDIELINAIDSFTAMYTLSSSLVSPLKETFFMGEDAIGTDFANSAKIYGTFNNGNDDAIIDYTLSCGPYQLEKWEKSKQIVFQRNDDWFEVGRGYYKIKGIHNRVLDTSTDSEKVYKEFVAGKLDVAGIPSSKVKEEKNSALKTIGDSTFKLNVNSCTQEQWDYLNEHVWGGNSKWDVKACMSNSHFLDGLFFAINRAEFADKRGVTPSCNYFSDSYMSNPKKGISYNNTQEHKDAIDYYHNVDKNGVDNFGYDFDRAIDNFRIAVNELSNSGDLVLGTQKNPGTLKIHIRWMYQTDIKEYGEDISSYITKAFNNVAVCGGKVKLEIEQEAVTNWEEVYNSWMMKGQFDLAFGAIAGNTYDPLNFLEVLKSDNSSSFTLNWGPNTAKVDTKAPIIYDNHAWSYDALWEVSDHGGIVQNGEKVKPVKNCYINSTTVTGASGGRKNLYEGYQVQIKLDFIDFSGEGAGKVTFDFSRLDVYVFGKGNTTLTNATYDPNTKIITATISEGTTTDEGTAAYINENIRKAQGFDRDTVVQNEDKKYPFTQGKYNTYWSYEVYFTIKIGENGSESETYVEVASGIDE